MVCSGRRFPPPHWTFDYILWRGPRAFGYARWRKDWVKVSGELAHERQAWGASIQRGQLDVVMPAQPALGECQYNNK